MAAVGAAPAPPELAITSREGENEDDEDDKEEEGQAGKGDEGR